MPQQAWAPDRLIPEFLLIFLLIPTFVLMLLRKSEQHRVLTCTCALEVALTAPQELIVKYLGIWWAQLLNVNSLKPAKLFQAYISELRVFFAAQSQFSSTVLNGIEDKAHPRKHSEPFPLVAWLPFWGFPDGSKCNKCPAWLIQSHLVTPTASKVNIDFFHHCCHPRCC